MAPAWMLLLALQALAQRAASFQVQAPAIQPEAEAGEVSDAPPFEIDFYRPDLWAGTKKFAASLAEDLDPKLAEALAACPTVVQGGCQDGDIPGRRCKDSFPSEGPPRRVWILIQAENTNGPGTWEHVRENLPPGDKAVFLGPWWNATHENYSTNGLRSIWVPFASTSFAQHAEWTPMDLWLRPKKRFNAARPHMVAYQQTHCKEGREEYWDLLNMEMMTSLNGTVGHNLSKCNGKRLLGRPLQLPSLQEMHLVHPFDLSVRRYENFRFVMTAENCDPKRPGVGYITEKIVNAYLAGAVPIYWGVAFERYGGVSFEQLERVFLPGTYIRADPDNEELRERSIVEILSAARNSSAYEELLRPGRAVVSEASMRRFFSWHPSVWPRFGDGLRRDILQAVLELCNDPTPAGP